ARVHARRSLPPRPLAPRSPPGRAAPVLAEHRRPGPSAGRQRPVHPDRRRRLRRPLQGRRLVPRGRHDREHRPRHRGRDPGHHRSRRRRVDRRDPGRPPGRRPQASDALHPAGIAAPRVRRPGRPNPRRRGRRLRRGHARSALSDRDPLRRRRVQGRRPGRAGAGQPQRWRRPHARPGVTGHVSRPGRGAGFVRLPGDRRGRRRRRHRRPRPGPAGGADGLGRARRPALRRRRRTLANRLRLDPDLAAAGDGGRDRVRDRPVGAGRDRWRRTASDPGRRRPRRAEAGGRRRRGLDPGRLRRPAAGGRISGRPRRGPFPRLRPRRQSVGDLGRDGRLLDRAPARQRRRRDDGGPRPRRRQPPPDGDGALGRRAEHVAGVGPAVVAPARGPARGLRGGGQPAQLLGPETPAQAVLGLGQHAAAGGDLRPRRLRGRAPDSRQRHRRQPPVRDPGRRRRWHVPHRPDLHRPLLSLQVRLRRPARRRERRRAGQPDARLGRPLVAVGQVRRRRDGDPDPPGRDPRLRRRPVGVPLLHGRAPPERRPGGDRRPPVRRKRAARHRHQHRRDRPRRLRRLRRRRHRADRGPRSRRDQGDRALAVHQLQRRQHGDAALDALARRRSQRRLDGAHQRRRWAALPVPPDDPRLRLRLRDDGVVRDQRRQPGRLVRLRRRRPADRDRRPHRRPPRHHPLQQPASGLLRRRHRQPPRRHDGAPPRRQRRQLRLDVSRDSGLRRLGRLRLHPAPGRTTGHGDRPLRPPPGLGHGRPLLPGRLRLRLDHRGVRRTRRRPRRSRGRGPRPLRRPRPRHRPRPPPIHRPGADLHDAGGLADGGTGNGVWGPGSGVWGSGVGGRM
ncbi:MAG: hypothetical protein AVDCRST_MAG73-426, partial [uncultured Thermomicrobiales bacterium]